MVIKMPMPRRVLPDREAAIWSRLRNDEQARYLREVDTGFTIHDSPNGAIWIEPPMGLPGVRPGTITEIRRAGEYPVAAAMREIRVEDGMEILSDWSSTGVPIRESQVIGAQIQMRVRSVDGTPIHESRVVRRAPFSPVNMETVNATRQFEYERALERVDVMMRRERERIEQEQRVQMRMAMLEDLNRRNSMTNPTATPTPDERHKAAEDWLKRQLSTVAANPLGAKDGFLNWCLVSWQEYLRRRGE